MENMQVISIGTIHTPFTEANGTPIQTAMAKGAKGWIELEETYLPALKDLDGFERIRLIYWFDRTSKTELLVKPFLDEKTRGLFATRAPCQPNPIGISSVRLLGIEKNILRIADVDILDGTPLLDIKPYAPRFDNFAVKRSGWLDKASVKRGVANERFSNHKEP